MEIKNLVKKFIPQFLLDFYHYFLALLSAFFYGFPSKRIKVVGVTGTNGKSTVVELITKILEEAKYKVASLSTIKFKIGDKERSNTLKMTMPGRFALQRFLRQAADSDCQYAILEVTSEGIKQHRHRFINFEVAVLTNLTPEHIEAHGGFEKYREAKGKFFVATKKIHILNLDDENVEYFLQFPATKKIRYQIGRDLVSSKSPLKDSNGGWFLVIKAENIEISQTGLRFLVNKTDFNLKLLGEFNIYNALAAICVALSQDIPLETCKKALEKIEGIPGRMEIVISQPFKVFVDYAFTPNALEKVYRTLTSYFSLPTSKLICVLGACGGGRDKWKRPILGKLAARYCDEVIVTNEDPYDENPMEIINQVANGTSSKAKKFLDRKVAISEALKTAKENDVIIITGKGCEPWICIEKGKKIPWDDRKVVREEFQKLQK